jgi:multidrug resistance protein, MATE family
LMGRLSVTALAAHQIALQVVAILFMVPFGISMAATVRVGHAVGRGDPAGVRRAGLIAMLIGIAFAAALTVVVVLLRFGIARLFLGEDMSNAAATIALAAQLLLIGGTFFLTDGLQSIAAGALRGLKDTSVPLLFAAISYWGIGFCTAYLLAFHTGLGPPGVWIGLSVGTLVYAALLVIRFRLLTTGLERQ